MAGIDFNALRARTMGSGNDEEAVTVNTRALIDKVLARYSGEWTVLRELIQNGVDANAKKIAIRFETSPSPSVPVPTSTDTSSLLKHVIRHHTLCRLVVANDGNVFEASDWSRLKRIAEGNPDETKIGAFGVGFYSVFADCEEPFVSSGNEAMAFYWKKNSLFTRRLQVPDGQGSRDTSFVLDYRSKTAPIPHLLGLCQFLATSLTFVGLQKIELWLDEWNLLTLTKTLAPSVSVALPRDIETRTTEGLMAIGSVERESAQIHAKWLNVVRWKPAPVSTSGLSGSGFGGGEIGGGMSSAPSLRSFFSKLTGGGSVVNSAAERAARFESEAQKAIAEDIAGVSTATVSLSITTANVHSSVTASFAREIERATKKPPPKTTKLAILTSSPEEGSISGQTSTQDRVDIFSTMLPSKSGKVFIGFPTHQTTGLLAHISAHSVIPTVERESIDLNARWVSTWNFEILRIAGIVCRIAWSGEMNEIREVMQRAGQALGRGRVRKEQVDSMMSNAVHVCKQFTFQDSTPSGQVSQLVEGAFWMCNKQATIEVFSTRGVLPSHEVRIATEDLSGFVDGIPVIPEALMKEAKGFVDKVRDLGLVSEITVTDVKKELEAKALDGRQLGEFLKWVAKKAKSGDIDPATIRSLLSVAVASVGQQEKSGEQLQLLLLGGMKYFVNPARISPDMPIPQDTMPFVYTKGIPIPELRALGWEELTVLPWLRFLVESSGRGILAADNNITASPKFAGQVLAAISKQWDQINSPSRADVIRLLENRTVIPTRQGMMKPAEAYFPSVRLFADLPVVTDLHSVRDVFLLALGVRKTVELGIVFERLMSDSHSQREVETSLGAKWSHVDLICYLASVRDDIPAADIKRLKDTPIFGTEGVGQPGSDKRYKISDLFAPIDSLRRLELPLLQWNGMFRPSSKEGKFLSFLGLKPFPSVPELVQIISKAAARGNMTLVDQTLAYWIRMHHENGYSSYDGASIETPFLPLQGEKSQKLSTPANCFTNDQATLLGFDILRKDLHPHSFILGVKPNPPMPECTSRLISKPPTTVKEAKELFGYFATRLAEIEAQSTERLGGAKIVPVPSKVTQSNGYIKEKQGVHHVSPKTCFLGDSSTYGSIFDFVDFGSEANSFLLKVGSKHEPTKSEIAYMLVREPARLLSTFQSAEKYLGLLRSLADSFQSLKKDKTLYREMRRAPFLLASKEIPSKSSKSIGRDQRASERFGDDFDDEDDSGIKEWRLASANEIIIVDDFASFNLFREQLLTAPQEEALETWYIELGASLLSSIVQEEPRVGSFIDDPIESKKLLKLVFERSRLFLHSIENRFVRNNVRWLERNLNAQTVHSLSVRRTLRGHNVSHTEKRTAIVAQDPKRGWTLWITASGYDMFQVSQGLVNLLILRPQFNLSLTLMSLLTTDLYTLRARGYNVDRILRAKAEEQRIAELNRQRQIEEQSKQIQEQEERWKKEKEGRSRPSKEKQVQVAMPGAFGPDSPEHVATQSDIQQADMEHETRKPKGIFSSFTKRLGLAPDDARPSTRHLQSFLNSNGESNNPQKDLPPPYSAQDTNQQQQQRPSETVTSPHQLQQNLLSAIQASRSYNSSELFSPPQTNTVKETATYCDTNPSQDLTIMAESAQGIKIFLSNSVPDKSGFLNSHSAGFNTFGALLQEIGPIFAVGMGCLHMYYDQTGGTIAFNVNGSIFCNYRFFMQLHLSSMQQESQPGEKRADALVYWWVVLCHELAHNLVPGHSSDHSFYTEQFVMTYFNKIMTRVARLSNGHQGGNHNPLPLQF
ncbi:hypothetical protein FGG08_003183 [Glutinoglossum americanum]|uniref:Sacsin/Nov domain-containing protein n=1 Tax=Glutinoglossum americanum TaxID=1670608 RepID=A0A9P8IDS7_9PEZI|nr:hypothetical protein FGG08_003183 [Glutinoglossum americanum]